MPSSTKVRSSWRISWLTCGSFEHMHTGKPPLGRYKRNPAPVYGAGPGKHFSPKWDSLTLSKRISSQNLKYALEFEHLQIARNMESTFTVVLPLIIAFFCLWERNSVWSCRSTSALAFASSDLSNANNWFHGRVSTFAFGCQVVNSHCTQIFVPWSYHGLSGLLAGNISSIMPWRNY